MGILNNIFNALKGLVSSVRGAFNNDPRYQQNFEWYPGSGGGGSYSPGDGIDISSNRISVKVDNSTIGFDSNGNLKTLGEAGVTKEYVDTQDQALQGQIDGIKNGTTIDSFLDVEAEIASIDAAMELKADKATTLSGYGITNAYTKTEVDTELDNKADKATTLAGYGITDAYTKTETDNKLDEKLDKRTTGVEVYSHSDATQGAFTVKTAMSDSPTNTNMLTEKAVKTYVDGKDPLKWNYVGILSASHGSTLTVKDDWTELLVAMRIQEGSAYYNLTNVIPKYGFTQGNPNGNQTFAGFFWNESYSSKIRIGLEGTGDSRKLKLNFSNSVGWTLNGIYVFKR